MQLFKNRLYHSFIAFALAIALALWQKTAEILLIFIIYFVQKIAEVVLENYISREWLVVKSNPTPHWIMFLMLHGSVYNIFSHYDCILAWYVPTCMGVSLRNSCWYLLFMMTHFLLKLYVYMYFLKCISPNGSVIFTWLFRDADQP